MTTTAITDDASASLKKTGLVLGPLLFFMTFFVSPPEGMSIEAWRACGVGLWMATWWVTEAMPLPVSSLLPIVLLPLLGLIPLKEVVAPFSSPIIFLFLGGFVISLAMEKYDLHLRIGLNILKAVGFGGKTVLAGMMLSTAFMGMWISNTATTIMMMPMAISMALLLSKGKDGEEIPLGRNYFAKAMILGVAYGAVFGGLGTFVGAPVNAILQGHMNKQYGYDISLADWMAFGVPIALILLGMTWLLLCNTLMKKAYVVSNVQEMVGNSLSKLGRISREEKIVLCVFLLTATLWVFSSQIEALLGRQIDDAMIAIFGALLLFVIPTRKNFEQFPLEWKDMQKLPWGMLIFFGGALSIADALTDLGVTRWLSSELSALHGMSLIMVVLIITVIIIAVSEMMSNIATITAFLPIISALSAALNINPLLIAVPATLAASCAFMLPGASAPNAIAFGTGHLTVKDMVKNGFWLDIFSIAVILISTFTLVSWALGIDVNVRPDWASGK